MFDWLFCCCCFFCFVFYIKFRHTRNHAHTLDTHRQTDRQTHTDTHTHTQEAVLQLTTVTLTETGNLWCHRLVFISNVSKNWVANSAWVWGGG
jgi:hypothetical protein